MSFKFYVSGYSCNDAKKLWNETMTYLRNSDFATFLVDGLTYAAETIHVCIAKDTENGYAHPKDTDKSGADGGYVVWNPESKTVVLNQKNIIFKKEVISPKLALLHELAHAHQYLTEKDRYVQAKAEGNSTDWLERNVVAAVEHTVANELNKNIKAKEGIRWEYEDVKKLSAKEQLKMQQQDNNTANIFGDLRKNIVGAGKVKSACEF